MEKDYIYEISSETSDLNQNNILKPYAYQKLLGQVVDWHLSKMKLNIGEVMKHSLAWAFVSLSIEIARPVEGIRKMHGQTWHSQRKGPFFRREFVFKDENGQSLFQGSSFSVLIDLDKRTIYRKRQLPFYVHEPEEDFAIEASPTVNIDLDFEKIDQRKVYNSYIDCLGHVNNICYGEFAYDALSQAECDNLHNLKRIDLYFKSELRNGDKFSILKAYDNNKIFVRGYNESKNEVTFDIVFGFNMEKFDII